MAGGSSSSKMVPDPMLNMYYNAFFAALAVLCVYLSVKTSPQQTASVDAHCKEDHSEHDDDDKTAESSSSNEHAKIGGSSSVPLFARRFGNGPLGTAVRFVVVGLDSARRLVQGPHTPFRAFQLNYLVVYSLVFISDWLQGPYIYALYKSYNYELDAIALLFVAGFLSSAVFGTFVGSIADRLGRRLGCQLFCVLYALSCLTKLSADFNMLMLGRLLGGISTSLLFSVFESWMVSEHHSRGFDESLLSETFAWSTFANGFVAIVSGVVANVAVDIWGLVAPFMVAAVFLCIAFVVIQATWTENYGTSSSSSTPDKSFWEVVQVIRRDPSIFAVGTMQFCFESAMYTFVFLWSPVMESVSGKTIALPFGVMFSSFMVCIMIGSTLFKWMMMQYQGTYRSVTTNNSYLGMYSHEWIAKTVFATASITFLVSTFASTLGSGLLTYIAFNVFEVCCGVYFPAIGSIRSKVVPESTRSTVMNIFRVPLNLIVVVILLKVDTVPASLFFGVCCALNAIAFVFAKRLIAVNGYGGSGGQSSADSPVLPSSSRNSSVVSNKGLGKDVLFDAQTTNMVQRQRQES